MIKVSYQQIMDNLSQLSRHNYLVLKSNAYGFGFEKIYQLAESLGFYKYAVITLDDAIYIKKKNPKNRVLLMGVFDESKIDIYQKYDREYLSLMKTDYYRDIPSDLNPAFVG